MFQKATKAKAKLRCAVFGPSGSGKTFTALRIAKGIGGKVAVIDTERMSASKYADRFEFDTCDLVDRSVAGYCDALDGAAKAGYTTVIIDSMSHAWQELCAVVEKIAQAKYKGNTWSAWSEGTPMQRRLVDSLLDFPGHIIATMRSKTEWQTSTGDNGKSRPIRVGLAPEQGKGIEYEFDLLLELNVDHVANVIKDRTGKWQDKYVERPGEEFGKQLAEWLEDGAEPPPPIRVDWQEPDKWPPDQPAVITAKVLDVQQASKGATKWLRVTVEDGDEIVLTTFHTGTEPMLRAAIGKVCDIMYARLEKANRLLSIKEADIKTT